MPDPLLPAEKSHFDLQGELLKGSTVASNLEQEILVIPVDCAKLCLHEHRDLIAAKNSWIAPLGVFFTLIATLFAADFAKSLFGISPAVWQAMFLLSAVGSFVWLIAAISASVRAWQKGGVEELIKKMKQTNSTKS